MDIKSAKKLSDDITFGEQSFDHFLEQLTASLSEQTFHLCLFVGKPIEAKQKALKQIANKTGFAVKEIDANEIITKIESETYKNLERLFTHFSADDTILHIKNGERFSGSYTAYTNSKVKYATPQERYFFNKMQETTGLYIIDLNDTVDGDTTLHRAAESIVKFLPPQSTLSRLLWKFKKVSVNGHEMETKRPERYGEQAGNF